MPIELGRWWFQRYVQSKTLIDPIPQRHRLIFEGIDRALQAEWLCRWRNSDTGIAYRAVHSTVGRGWRPDDADRCSRSELTLVARFLTGHCHLGDFALPWDLDELVACPWCGHDFSREHLLWECTSLSSVRAEVLQVGTHVGDLEWVAWHRAFSLGRFLVLARRLVDPGSDS